MSPHSNGGCAITSTRQDEATLWFWSLLVIGLVRMRAGRRDE
jgi:hypothetical protein